MMKRFNLLPMMILILSAPLLNGNAKATTAGFRNDSAGDMLRSTGDEESDNADTAEWGTTGSKGRAEKVVVAKPLQAIDESSFASEGNRAPASMRGPAAVKPIAAKKPLPSAKTMVRVMKQKKAYQEAAVIVNDLGFFPSTLFVTQGIPVRLYVTGASQRSQCMILDAFGVRRQIRNQKVEEVTFTPDQAGKFAFTCPMNGAKGTIVVKELEINDRLPASEPKETSMAEPQQEKASDIIKDSDFGVEFREKP